MCAWMFRIIGVPNGGFLGGFLRSSTPCMKEDKEASAVGAMGLLTGPYRRYTQAKVQQFKLATRTVQFGHELIQT